MKLNKVTKGIKIARIVAKAGVEVADEFTDGKASKKVEKAKQKVKSAVDKAAAVGIGVVVDGMASNYMRGPVFPI